MTAAGEKTYCSGWWVLMYRVSVLPSYLRARIRKRIEAVGAVHLQRGVVALPDHPATTPLLSALYEAVSEVGAAPYLLRCDAIAGHHQLTALYNSARDQEYLQLIDDCDDLEVVMAEGMDRGPRPASELASYVEGAAELRCRLAMVEGHDVLGASQARRAQEAVVRYECAAPRLAQGSDE